MHSSTGGFPAFEHLLSIPASVELHKKIGGDRIASRIRELNAAFRKGARKIPGLTLHTPSDPELSAGISCFELKGATPEEVDQQLAAKKIRTNASPYKTSYATVAAGIMNFPEEVGTVLKNLSALGK